ncbi:uncharacterized protein MKK02DRAFT_40978 [Dioszegia hungarica]|uniref:Uncharacterized protein n=1 Tax=Dioszegia hungarica TaxID=4972 RepID=A0AA38LTL1_9TREE|nr:uncharacterized protein MKK02DRAFT_40978 [Dioszegia hungarica]KAI9632671.1 hypothetical protein MKK02DRAFT_40978 [Dioszegia hungarica]
MGTMIKADLTKATPAPAPVRSTTNYFFYPAQNEPRYEFRMKYCDRKVLDIKLGLNVPEVQPKRMLAPLRASRASGSGLRISKRRRSPSTSSSDSSSSDAETSSNSSDSSSGSSSSSSDSNADGSAEESGGVRTSSKKRDKASPIFCCEKKKAKAAVKKAREKLRKAKTKAKKQASKRKREKKAEKRAKRRPVPIDLTGDSDDE